MNEWKDFEKEKPQDAELVLVWGRERYHKCYTYALMTYFADDDSFSEFVPYQGGVNVRYWLRLPQPPDNGTVKNN